MSKATKFILAIAVSAVQLNEDNILTSKEDKTKSFEGEPLKGQQEGETPFILVKEGGSLLRVEKGEWLVTFPDGHREVRSNAFVQDNMTAVEVVEEGTPEQEPGPDTVEENPEKKTGEI